MFRVYYAVPNEKPVWLASFDAEEFAQVLIDAGNKFYEGEREFYFEDSAADDDTLYNDDISDEYKAGLLRDFERTEAQAYNKELSTFAVRF